MPMHGAGDGAVIGVEGVDVFPILGVAGLGTDEDDKGTEEVESAKIHF